MSARAELLRYLSASTEPAQSLRVLTPGGAHLPTLEAVRQIVQERADKSEKQLGRLNSEGIQSPYAEGYISAMNHVLDYLKHLEGRP